MSATVGSLLRRLRRRRPDEYAYRIDDPSPARLRPKHGTCPGCQAGELEWCRDDCGLVDQADYR